MNGMGLIVRFSTLLTLLILGGCTTTHVLELPPAPDRVNLLTETLAGREAEVLLTSGDTLQFRSIALRGTDFDTLIAYGEDADSSSIAFNEISEIKVLGSRGRGALEGALFGAVVGGLFGALIGPDDSCKGLYCSASRGETAIIGGMSAALTWGPIIGALIGHRIRIRVQRGG